MKLFKIHTEENEKDIDFGIHGVYADNEKDAIRYAETEIVDDFLSMGYKVKTKRTSKYSIIHVWDDDIKYRRIIIWAIEKEKKNTTNADTCDRDCAKCELLKKTEDLLSACNIVIQTLEQTKWISCNKRLPKVNEYYLVQNGYGDMLVAKYVKKDCWEEIYSRHKLGVLDDIVAWMPLPKKYKTESEKEK